MSTFIILELILLFYFSRILFSREKNKKYLLLSFFIVSVPFELTKVIGSENTQLVSGTLGSNIMIILPNLFLLGIIILTHEWKKLKRIFLFDFWVKILFMLIIVSLINPNNSSLISTVIFAIFVFQYLILFNLFHSTLSYFQIIEGLFDGFRVASIIQLILAICFPILKMKTVTSLFHTASIEWSTRLGSRDGAVGFFVSPGNLAIFNMIAIAFFFSCYTNKIKKTYSLIFLIFNIITLFLTYSRTAYLSTVVMIFCMYFINRYSAKNIFSIVNLLKVILPICLILSWVVFYSPVSDLFLKSDGTEQYDNRMVHWLMAGNIFSASPILGVGLNSHLSFLKSNYTFASSVTFNEFFTSNPIHNIHLIVLSEIGLLGFILWIVFFLRLVNKLKISLSLNNNKIIPLSTIGIIIAFFLYGITGWAPFSVSILPYFIFFVFYSIKVIGSD
ncbi:O-antigen ligase family protein [Emticicia sp. W12TSBA100-4]|uniref:O-antigen ligase family protein n=1 Tax=Emticicia sp. W12TSBA100-4 TaxID=3160965 RepID=UPI00330639FA